MATRLDLNYDVQVLAVRKRVQQYSARYWDGLGAWRDADADRLIAALVPRVEAGQARIAQLTDAYIARVAADGGSISRGSVADASTESLRGVPADEVYQRPFVEMRTKLSEGSTVSTAVAAGGARLLDLVSTGMQLAKTHSARAALERTGAAGFERVLTGRENCALCVIASTQRYHRGNLLPIHPGCVPEGTPVSAESVQAVTRRYFKGELIEFVTAAGDQVRVTPNHPVLTDHGWVPAGLLSSGDAVFRGSVSQGVVGGRPKVDQRPTLVEDVFDAARVAFPLVRVPLASEDFHADVAEGEVDVVYTDGHLATVGDVSFAQHPSERGLVDAHGGRLRLDGGGSLGALVPGGLAPLGGGVGSSGLRGNLLGSHLGGAKNASATTPTRFDAPAGQFTPESVTAYAERGMNLVGRLAGLVEVDRIVELRRVSWSGHVFNLQTREGWYSSNNHIVSNCDCGVKPYFGDPNEQVINSTRLESIHDAITNEFGQTDRAARYIEGGKDRGDYTDLLVTYEHSEYGPTLAWRDQHHTILR